MFKELDEKYFLSTFITDINPIKEKIKELKNIKAMNEYIENEYL